MIVLFAFRKRGYVQQAYNLAFSLKHFSPDIPVTLFHDGIINKFPEEKRHVFDSIVKIENPDIAKFKAEIYDLSPYDETLYLDVDGIALKDISPLIHELQKQNFYTHISGRQALNEGSSMRTMLWAFSEDIVSHFDLRPETILPSSNTSILWFKKTDEVKNLFEQWKLALDNPIPLKKLRHQWGAAQPDELYLNIAIAKTGIKVSDEKYMFFGGNLVNKTFGQITDENYFLSIYGGRGFTKQRYTEWYDRLLWGYHKPAHHVYQYNRFANEKHANKTAPVLNGRNEQLHVNKLLKLIPALIPISKTVLIKSENLIQSYPDERGHTNKITNWFNCSMIEFNGKKYFAYRMESRPWCERMRIGLCLLDDNYQPIKESNVLPELHSALTLKKVNGSTITYAKGFHVEDPRLFVFNNQLYLSYTDGYQMAQARINPDTLHAEESFYLLKPDENRTEKNWTFFEHDMKLHCVYDINNHIVWTMDGNHKDKEYSTSFQHDWKYGDIKGGTPPIRIGDKFISFFHSTLQMRIRNRDGRQYFMGAYTFEAQAPFKPLQISVEPFISGELINNNIPRLNNNIFVVFPSGVIRKENSFVVSLGYNDLECRFVEISDSQVEQNMTDIKYPPKHSSAFDRHEKISGMNKSNGHIKIAEHA